MKSRSGCSRYEALMTESVDGIVSPDDRAQLEGHLGGCADCRREFEAATMTARALEALPSEDLPPFFETRLFARLEDLERGVQPAHRPSPHRSLRLAWGSAAVLAIALVGTLFRFQTERTAVRPSESSMPPLSQAQAPEAQAKDEARVSALRAGIQPVSPLDDSVVSASDVAICAALSPTLPQARFRLLIDGRDVTALADVTRDYIIFAPEGEELGDGPHLVTVELDTGHERIERSWIFHAMNGHGRDDAGRESLPETREQRPAHGRDAGTGSM